MTPRSCASTGSTIDGSGAAVTSSVAPQLDDARCTRPQENRSTTAGAISPPPRQNRASRSRHRVVANAIVCQGGASKTNAMTAPTMTSRGTASREPTICDVPSEPPHSHHESATFLLGGAGFVAVVGAAVLTLGSPWTYGGAVLLVAAVVLFVVALLVYFDEPKPRQGAAFMAVWKNELATRNQTQTRLNMPGQAAPVRIRAIYRGPILEVIRRRKLTKERLDAALAQFPASQRELFLAHYQYGRPLPPLASATRMPTGQVQAILVRIADQVASELGPNWQKVFLPN